MNEKERWLKQRTKALNAIDTTEQTLIDRLNKKDLLEAELSSCIDCLEVLLSLDALIPLLHFMNESQQSMILRKQAAKAISVIGSDYIESDLLLLKSSPSPELRLLADIALGIKSPNKT